MHSHDYTVERSVRSGIYSNVCYVMSWTVIMDFMFTKLIMGGHIFAQQNIPKLV